MLTYGIAILKFVILGGTNMHLSAAADKTNDISWRVVSWVGTIDYWDVREFVRTAKHKKEIMRIANELCVNRLRSF